MKAELVDASGALSAAYINLCEDVREALKQALSETLARFAARENLDSLLDQLVRERAFSAAVLAPEPTQPVRSPLAPLTAREQEILSCIAAGDSNKVIARTFDLSLHTVKRHVANILTKLGVSSRVQAAAWMSARH